MYISGKNVDVSFGKSAYMDLLLSNKNLFQSSEFYLEKGNRKLCF